MSSLTTIGNNALKNIGATGEMVDYSTDTSREGDEVRRNIYAIINEILEEHDWGFARRTRELALHADDPPASFSYRYTLFPDCLVPLEIVVGSRPRNADPLDFDVMQDDAGLVETLVTDTANACLTYTSNLFVTKTLIWSHNFERCVEHKLSYILAVNLKKSSTVIQAQFGLYQAALRKAVYVSNKGRRRYTQQAPRSVRARRS